MKLPISWLKKYIQGPLPTPERLAELLTLSGTAVDRIEKVGAETVLNIEVTTNRSDSLSVLGLAREFSALSGSKTLPPKISSLKNKKLDAFRVQVFDKKGCPFYTACFIENVRVVSAPEEAARLVSLTGARPVNNVVDATNFVLFETGQPLHAFDADKIEGHTLMVRRAKRGEKFLGLDGSEHVLDPETLVIADASKPVAIAGVMGGKLTEITAQTKNVLLESAAFDPCAVRRSSKRYKISTESSYRFERGVDLEKVKEASQRARDLILEWAGGGENGFLAVGSDRVKKASIGLRESRIQALLGRYVPLKRARQILNRLGFSARSSGKGRLVVSTWNARRDVTREADLIEEILRIEGFDKIPVRIPVTRHGGAVVRDLKIVAITELKKCAAAMGFSEIVSYSLLSKKALEDSGVSLESAQRVTNAPSAEQEYFRPSLLPGMLGAVSFNLNRKAQALRLFEVGRCIGREGKEETYFAAALSGLFEENWLRKSPSTLFDLKGAAGNWLRSLNSCGPEAKNLSQVSVEVLTHWGIQQDVFYFECSLDRVLNSYGRAYFQVKPVPKFPFVRRDIAFVIDENIAVGALEETMRKAAQNFLAETRLFDQFTGKNIPQGKRSLAFALFYQKPDGTFTDEEIRSLQDRVGAALKEGYRVEFRLTT